MGTKACRTCLSEMEFGDRYKRQSVQQISSELTIEGDGHLEETLPLNANMDFDDEGIDTKLPSNNPVTKHVHTSEQLDTTKNTEKVLENIVMNENDQNIEHVILERYSTHKFAQEQQKKEAEVTSTKALKIEINSEQTQSVWEQDQVIYLENEMKKQTNDTPTPTAAHLLQSDENKLKKSNIYRHYSPNEWNTEQVKQHENEIKEELLNLSKHISHLDMDTLTSSLSVVSQEILSPAQENTMNKDVHTLVLNEFSTEASEDESDTPKPIIPSNLFRHQSEQKWNNPLIDKQKKEMSKQLIHLARQHKDSLVRQNDEFVYI